MTAGGPVGRPKLQSRVARHSGAQPAFSFMSQANTPDTAAAPVAHDENQLIAERREKLKALREAQKRGEGVAFPNDHKPTDNAAALFAAHGQRSKEELEATPVRASVAGRMMLKRVMGKASFATLQDASLGESGGRIQIYLNNDSVGEAQHGAFKHWDLGDIVAAEGVLFRTRTGELTIHADKIRLLTKSLRPLPDKFHGVADQEIKYRQRYVDLMTDEAARRRFVARSQAITALRQFMVAVGEIAEIGSVALPQSLDHQPLAKGVETPLIDLERVQTDLAGGTVGDRQAGCLRARRIDGQDAAGTLQLDEPTIYAPVDFDLGKARAHWGGLNRRGGRGFGESEGIGLGVRRRARQGCCAGGEREKTVSRTPR